MSETLYRKYRPQTFAEVAEQEHVLRTITRQLATNSVAHAYLFSGPRGVGKTTIARLLAKALNCENRKDGEYEPCNTCGACTDFQDGRMLSCIEIDAASQTGVDNVRENIIENARFAPTRGRYRIFILDEVHMLSSSSFNALLKTLEEPPAHAIFILATTELHKIPATIISRCQRFDFHRVSPVVMMPRLASIAEKEGVLVDESVLAQIARLSEGCLRDGESLLGQVVALGEKHVTQEVAMLVLPMTNIVLVCDMLHEVGRGEVKAAIDQLNAFVRDGGSVKHLVEEMIDVVRTVLFMALGDTSLTVYDEKTNERLRAIAAVLGSGAARRLLDALLVARTRSTLPTLPQIPLEIALLAFADIGKEHEAHVENISQAPRDISTMQRTVVAPVVAPIVKTPERAPNTRYDFSQPVAPKVEEISLTSSSDAPVFPVEDLADKWERCIAYVAERNVALPLVLNSAKPTLVQGNTVTVLCAYAFHAEALKEAKARRLLEEAIEHVMQVPVVIAPVYIQKKHDDAVTTFITELGGNLA